MPDGMLWVVFLGSFVGCSFRMGAEIILGRKYLTLHDRTFQRYRLDVGFNEEVSVFLGIESNVRYVLLS